MALACAADMLSVTIHVDDELLDEYFLRRADDYTSAAVQQHLQQCSECRVRLQELREMRAALRVVNDDECG